MTRCCETARLGLVGGRLQWDGWERRLDWREGKVKGRPVLMGSLVERQEGLNSRRPDSGEEQSSLIVKGGAELRELS